MNMLLTLAGLFGKLSLLAFGGVNSTIPELAKQIVQSRHWLTAQQFIQLYAIGQAAPGPNLLVVTLIGSHVAGIAGGIVASIAMIAPAGALVIVVSHVWDRNAGARWRLVLQAAMSPITAGLLLAASYVLVRQADGSVRTAAITAVTAFCAWRTGLHPLWLLAGGAVCGGLIGL